MVKIILPCAGFGLRMGKPESKEMLPLGKNGKPLIEFSLGEAEKRHWPVLVITRPEKRNLLQYLEQKKDQGMNLEILLIESSKEWPDSILRAKECWADINLLILPDTHWEPVTALDDMANRLQKCPVVYGVFQLRKDKKFGFVRCENGAVEIHEKPDQPHPRSRPWGLMGFHRSIGEELLRAHLNSTFDHQAYLVRAQTEFVELSSFEDLTRPNLT